MATLNYTAAQIDALLAKADTAVQPATTGDLDNLATSTKTDLVSAINETFTSVSDGKTLVAAAITDKGVATAATDSFSTMATNIAAIPSGGGGGLEYEEGTYSPNADTASIEVLFSNVHTTAPFYCVIQDADATTLTVDAMLYWAVINLRDLYGTVTADNVQVYGRVQFSRRTSSGQAAGGSHLTTSAGVNAVLTSAKFDALNTPAYFRSDRTYKWIAVWKP